MLFILLYANEEIICGISAEGFLLLFVDEEVFLKKRLILFMVMVMSTNSHLVLSFIEFFKIHLYPQVPSEFSHVNSVCDI